MKSSHSSDQFDAFSYSMITAFVLALLLYLNIEWSKTPGNLAELTNVKVAIFPPVTDVIDNIKLIFHGYHSGYLRTCLGYLIFTAMAIFFVSSGKLVLRELFHEKNQGHNVIGQLTFLERISLYYILGSLAASLLWLGLGCAGILNQTTAVIVGFSGFVIFLSELSIGRINFNTVKTEFINWNSQSSLTEKFLIITIFISLMLWSTMSVLYQTYTDTYQIHLPLPSMYIHDGQIATNPYFIYSYFPQNTEMLVLWSLLFKSEAAATLLMWGFLASFVFLMAGFLKRQTNNMIALLVIPLLVSAPLVSLFSKTIKNDFPAALFLFAHYVTMAQGLNEYSSNKRISERWMLLSGMLCGGAIGHKLTALIPASISFAFLALHELPEFFDRNVKRPFPRIMTLWLCGLLTALPWFIRSALATGNPVYPYFSKMFHLHLVKPWHIVPSVSTSIQRQGWSALKDYFCLLLGISHEQNGAYSLPNWGPQLLYVFLLPLCLRKNIPIGFRLSLGSAFISWLVNLGYSFEARYHMASLMYLNGIPIALCLHRIIQKPKFSKVFTYVALVITSMCAYQNLSHSKIFSMTRLSCSQFLSGYSPDNFTTPQQTDPAIYDLRWMGHMIETRTRQRETVLFAGMPYGYGVDRKIFYGIDPDIQILQDMAEHASGGTELYHNLRRLGVDHILFSSTFLESSLNNRRTEYRLKESDARKITELFKNYMILRCTTPKGNILWYTFKDVENTGPVTSNASDIQEYPRYYLEAANMMLNSGNADEAYFLLTAISHQPLHRFNKANVYALLSKIFAVKGAKEKSIDAIQMAIKIFPENPNGYVILASLYDLYGEHPEEIGLLIGKAIKLGGMFTQRFIEGDSHLSKYLNTRTGS